jgi:hypothetical protein
VGSILKRVHDLPPGTVIPKPKAKDPFTIKGWGSREKQPALVYYIPNHGNPSHPHQKGITEKEWERAYEELVRSGELTKPWFDGHLHRCSKEGSCNFTTIGGVFSLLGIATYQSQGVYRKIA